MKKGKTILSAAALGAVLFMAWLTLGRKDPEQSQAVTVAPLATPDLPTAAATPVPARRLAARKAVRALQAPAEVQAEPAVESDAAEIPMPSGWNGQFTKQDLHAETQDCDIDRPCSPRGRDGVLLLGASFALNGLVPQMPQILSVGSYERRTPLLVYK